MTHKHLGHILVILTSFLMPWNRRPDNTALHLCVNKCNSDVKQFTISLFNNQTTPNITHIHVTSLPMDFHTSEQLKKAHALFLAFSQIMTADWRRLLSAKDGATLSLGWVWIASDSKGGSEWNRHLPLHNTAPREQWRHIYIMSLIGSF